MCGYTLHLTNSTNRCGNYNIVLGHPADPTIPRVTKDGSPPQPYCNMPECRYQRGHSRSPYHADPRFSCDQLGCSIGP
ncbi:uncharacterized protein SCHCODRAFT_02579783 [Schizophyllum commune H4-8]|uniref:uncharacterized protein n=1 Tax=Schizophyllum commune (strain H4-8 / FGSC 9210) TaxID=578458 RepID=UPI00215F599F|nr:uncharacterized protein SCHCODRAFT_02579783 [Schizophyllum commune H4-8]KAI5892893.1 hypothetical protein SCHCODRAFT_02579783 [Schizophyllum commune H4-8]